MDERNPRDRGDIQAPDAKTARNQLSPAKRRISDIVFQGTITLVSLIVILFSILRRVLNHVFVGDYIPNPGVDPSHHRSATSQRDKATHPQRHQSPANTRRWSANRHHLIRQRRADGDFHARADRDFRANRRLIYISPEVTAGDFLHASAPLPRENLVNTVFILIFLLLGYFQDRNVYTVGGLRLRRGAQIWHGDPEYQGFPGRGMFTLNEWHIDEPAWIIMDPDDTTTYYVPTPRVRRTENQPRAVSPSPRRYPLRNGTLPTEGPPGREPRDHVTAPEVAPGNVARLAALAVTQFLERSSVSEPRPPSAGPTTSSDGSGTPSAVSGVDPHVPPTVQRVNFQSQVDPPLPSGRSVEMPDPPPPGGRSVEMPDPPPPDGRSVGRPE